MLRLGFINLKFKSDFISSRLEQMLQVLVPDAMSVPGPA